MYIWKITAGELWQDGIRVGVGWAGQGSSKNNPDAEALHLLGPLPEGLYMIGPAYHHPKLGPVTMNLTPDPGNEMYGRGDFRMHGAAEKNPELSSEGCIILLRTVREFIAQGLDADNNLTVVR